MTKNHQRMNPQRAHRFVLRLVLALLAGACVAPLARAQTWGQRLGFPADKRVLILHASEMGLCYESNLAGQEGLAKGQFQSASVMTPSNWFVEFAQWAKEHPDADVGLSITLDSPYPLSRWRPITPRSMVHSLVDADGYLWSSVQQIATNAHALDAQRELHAQIEWARDQGFKPGHLDTHFGTMFARVDLASVYLHAARKYWIPAVVVELTPELINRFRNLGFPLDQDMIALVASYPLPKIDGLEIMPRGDSYEQQRDRFLELVASLPPGITQIHLLPSQPGKALARLTDDAQQRVWAAQMLADPKVQEFFKKEGIQQTNWKEIMRRFEGKGLSVVSEQADKDPADKIERPNLSPPTSPAKPAANPEPTP